jgi:hypothetical protein
MRYEPGEHDRIGYERPFLSFRSFAKMTGYNYEDPALEMS